MSDVVDPSQCANKCLGEGSLLSSACVEYVIGFNYSMQWLYCDCLVEAGTPPVNQGDFVGGNGGAGKMGNPLGEVYQG